MTIFLENSPAGIIWCHPLVKMIECPGKERKEGEEGEKGWDIMTGGSNKISHKYTLTNTYKVLHGKSTESLGRYIEKSP